MKITICIISLISSIFFLTGCTGNAVYMKTEKSYTQTNFKDIKVYSTVNPSSNYEVLGYISTYTSSADRAGDMLKENLRKQAAKYGADAIIGFKFNIAQGGGGGAQGVAVRLIQ
jgi:uncharacterized protein YbjQ (UPF0145 family)